MDDNSVKVKNESWKFVGIVALFSLILAIYPTIRAFYHFEANYNEGWNIYNSVALTHHIPLYATKYGWTTVNYPLLSFYVVPHLSRLTHDDLMAGRLLSLFSLCASCIIVGFIIKKLTNGLAGALFGGFFCLGAFCAMAPDYVGVNDPQLFAQVFLLGGLLLYVSRSPSPSLGSIGAIVLLFAIGGNIKHNSIDFPLAIFLDLFLISRKRAWQFAFFLGVAGAISIAANIWAGGPFFLSNLLSGRSYSLTRAMLYFVATNLPVLTLLAAAGIWAARKWNIQSNRPLSIFFFCSLIVGVIFGGGEGVSSNIYFDNLLSLSVIVGILFHDLSKTYSFKGFRFSRWGFTSLLLACLLFADVLTGNASFWRRVVELPQKQAEFDREVSFLANRPGPAICESLLRCFDAGKPYVYDPFNSHRFILAGKLDDSVILDKIATHQYSAIQVDLPIRSFEQLSAQLPRQGFHPVTYSEIQLGPFGAMSERFSNAELEAIDTFYMIAVENPDCDIYVPREDMEASHFKRVRE